MTSLMISGILRPSNQGGGWVEGRGLNIKMPSYQYRDSHVKHKTVSPSVLSLTWESHTWERRSLYWDGARFLHLLYDGQNVVTMYIPHMVVKGAFAQKTP